MSFFYDKEEKAKQEFRLKLLKEVELRPMLYDTRYVSNNYLERDFYWAEIAEKLDTTVLKCKSTWAYFKAKYVQAYPRTDWFFAQHMKFYEPVHKKYLMLKGVKPVEKTEEGTFLLKINPKKPSLHKNVPQDPPLLFQDIPRESPLLLQNIPQETLPKATDQLQIQKPSIISNQIIKTYERTEEKMKPEIIAARPRKNINQNKITGTVDGIEFQLQIEETNKFNYENVIEVDVGEVIMKDENIKENTISYVKDVIEVNGKEVIIEFLDAMNEDIREEVTYMEGETVLIANDIQSNEDNSVESNVKEEITDICDIDLKENEESGTYMIKDIHSRQNKEDREDFKNDNNVKHNKENITKFTTDFQSQDIKEEIKYPAYIEIKDYDGSIRETKEYLRTLLPKMLSLTKEQRIDLKNTIDQFLESLNTDYNI